MMSLRPESRLASICLRKQAGREEFTTLTLGKSSLISRSRICRLTDNQQRVLSAVTAQISSIAQLLLAQQCCREDEVRAPIEMAAQENTTGNHQRQPGSDPLTVSGCFLSCLFAIYECTVSHQVSQNRHWDSSKANLMALPLTRHSYLVIRTIILHLLFPSTPCPSIQLFFLVACSTTLTCIV